ncbi:LPS-assembly protein [Malonomonas rubra DSM 5091]|uniref:LPS-assembly protein n=1 Tax=Malonomonas rubra DSM 5091 TaxID=1122189 RepID=A0A1M6F1X8_MALRU|nr:LPS assembly protein LptD [Malonomonas rubra]SHI91646.1 LPS-assembly protein [Malonomonas rubra DSM 5091]
MRVRLLTIIFVVCLVLPALAADWGKDSPLPVNLEADELSYDKETGRYRASGNVQLNQGELEVVSDLLWWNQLSGEIEAEGGVQLTSPDEKMTGSKVSYNLQQGTGSVADGWLFLQESNLHVRGKQINRLGENSYRVFDGTFTTCDGEVPSWKFGAEQVDVTLGGYAKAKHTVFYLKDIPSFYVPYMVYPVKTERESGLLIPRIGYSDKRGFQYNGSYYQVLGRNQDATLLFDYLSEMGIGKGLEYRYIFGKDNAGEMRGYHIDVDSVDGETVDEERYALEWQHDGTLPGDVRMVVDAVYVNDEEYFEDFGEVAEDYNKDEVESNFSLSKSWGKYSLVGDLEYTKDLESDNDSTLQRLPRISFDAARQRIGETPFYYRLETEYTNFRRDEGVTGERLMLLPTLSASLQLFNVIDISPKISYRDRYYWGTSDGYGDEHEGLVEFSTRVSTKLQRVYDQPIGSADKLKHSLEPEVIYYNIPELEQNHLPQFDTYDDIDKENRFEYALVQRLTARFDQDGGAASYRELLYLRLSQTYYLSADAVGEKDSFGSIRGQLTLLPTTWAKFEFDGTYDIDLGEWEETDVDLSLQDQNENSLRASYSYDRDEELEYVSFKLDLSILEPFFVSYEKRFDLVDDESLEDVIGVEYRQQCWSALLTYRENENDSSVILSFVMKGIGPVGGVSGSLGGI